jgi:small neutral amino acid transporter SnatA (MarC family)
MSRTKTSTIRNTSARAAAPVPSAGAFTFGDRVFLKFGPQGTRAIYLFMAFLLLALVFFVDYLLVLFTAVNVVPNIAVLIQQGTGVTPEMRIDAVIAGWLLPVLFIVAAVLVGEIFMMRRLGRFARGVRQTMRRSLFRLMAEEKQPAPAVGRAGLKHRETKIAAAS